MAANAEAVYCTLLMSDNYLPGAVVLAYSLRDNGTKAKLVALFTPENLKDSTIRELGAIYDEIIPVRRVTNATPANLYLMDRPDLVAAFTKIELWRQTQFNRIVYLDCDVLALRAPDELLSLNVDFAAAPDVGWPDCFNSGVMVLRPNMQDYYSLRALAERGISFDGADQGLFNMHFKDWHRLSFTYNCTPSANYQYIPAYKHFESTIALLHFIGPQKPWSRSRYAFAGETPYSKLLGRWWAVYDRHYQPQMSRAEGPNISLPISQYHALPETVVPAHDGVLITDLAIQVPSPEIEEPVRSSTFSERHSPMDAVASLTRVAPEIPDPCLLPEQSYEPPKAAGPTQPPTQEYPNEAHPVLVHSSASVAFTEPGPADRSPAAPEHSAMVPPPFTYDRHQIPLEEEHQTPILSAVPQYVCGEEHVSIYFQPHKSQPQAFSGPGATAQKIPRQSQNSGSQSIDHREQQPDNAQLGNTQPGNTQLGNAQPSNVQLDNAQPSNVQLDNVQPSDAPPTLPEPRSFSPPKIAWDPSLGPPPLHSKPEAISLQTPIYAMSEDTRLFQPPESYPEAPRNMYYEVPSTKPKPEKLTPIFPWEGRALKPTRVFAENPGSEGVQTSSESVHDCQSLAEFAVASVVGEPPGDPWESFSLSNAWDEVPEIERYIKAIQRSRKGNVQVVTGGTHPGSGPTNSDGLSGRKGSIRITDFPTEVERPSLPVTPAPIRRTSVWGQTPVSPADLPTAEGVPNQEDWNPLARLEELQRQHSELLKTSEKLSKQQLASGPRSS